MSLRINPAASYMIWLSITGPTYNKNYLFTAIPMTLASSLFLKHIKHVSTSGPLHLLFPMPRTALPHISL